nr:hypothetical protein BaRGS_029353 [Batillaria attramentaria]
MVRHQHKQRVPLLRARWLFSRCVESEEGIQPHALAHFGVPTDFVDLASGEDPFKFRDFLQLGTTQKESSSEDEDNGDDDDDAANAGAER